jgi:hypothetical protein
MSGGYLLCSFNVVGRTDLCPSTVRSSLTLTRYAPSTTLDLACAVTTAQGCATGVMRGVVCIRAGQDRIVVMILFTCIIGHDTDLCMRASECAFISDLLKLNKHIASLSSYLYLHRTRPTGRATLALFDGALFVRLIDCL